MGCPMETSRYSSGRVKLPKISLSGSLSDNLYTAGKGVDINFASVKKNSGMGHLLHLMLCIILPVSAAGFTSCSDDSAVPQDIVQEDSPEENQDDNQEASQDDNQGNDTDNNNDNMERNITITVGGKAFPAVLEDNEAAAAFAAMLPVTLQMSELNGNEKYFYLDSPLPAHSTRPGTINEGDLMLYGSSCVVLFYETFRSGYSYTRLGRIANPDGLAEAVGDGSVQVHFEVTGQQ